MVQDNIHIQPEFYATAQNLFALLPSDLLEHKYCIAIAGESGSGKSVTAVCLKEVLAEKGIHALVLHQDDYFLFPPLSNHQKREADISWVGFQEVNFEVLEQNIVDFQAGKEQIEKPLVYYKENRISSEILSLQSVSVLIIEGTYCMKLENTDKKIFISRSYLDTYQQRLNRGRDIMSPFVEKVLEIEHQLIAPMKALADVVIDENYEVIAMI